MKRSYIIVVLLLSVTACFFIIKNKIETSSTKFKRVSRPINYDFGSENTINFGNQPLFLPAGVPAQLMERDQILLSQLKKLNKEFRVHGFYKGNDINKHIETGKLDVAIASNMPTVWAAAKGLSVVVAIAQKGVSSIISGKKTLFKELKGTRMAIAKGSIAHYSAVKAIKEHDMQFSDINFVYMDVYDMERALENGYVDSVATWEPISSIILGKTDRVHTLFQTSSLGFLYFSKKFYDNNPRMVKEILKSYIRAINWMKESTDNRKVIGKIAINRAEKFLDSPFRLPFNKFEKIVMNNLLFLTPSAVIPESTLGIGGPMLGILSFLKSQKVLGGESTLEALRESFDFDAVKLLLKDRKKNKLNTFNYTI